MHQLKIRKGQSSDAQALVDLSAQTFTETFGHLYAPEDLAAFLTSAYVLEEHEQQLEDPDFAVWVLELGEGVEAELVGYALAGPCGLPHEDVQPEDRELKRLYILADYQGGGHGAQLIELVLDWIGQRTAWLGVWSENHGAQRLYKRYGFEKAGEYFFEVGQHRDHEFIFRRQP